MGKGLNKFLVTAAAFGIMADFAAHENKWMSLSEIKYQERGMKIHKRTKPQKRKMKFKKKRR